MCQGEDTEEPKQYATFSLAAKNYEGAYRNQVKYLQTATSDKLESRLADKKKGAMILSTYLKVADAPKPITYARRIENSPKGQKDTFTHDPSEIYEITRKLWDRVYDGDPKQQSVRVADFHSKYKHHITHQNTMAIPALTMEDVKRACQKRSRTAAGLYNFEPEDFSRFSYSAYAMLVLMFNTIEAGARWPNGNYLARSAYLSKGQNTTDDPMAYRALTILNVSYRRWATTWLATLRPWIATWDQTEICAGGIGKRR